MLRKPHLVFCELGRGNGEMSLRMWLENSEEVIFLGCRDSPFRPGLLRKGDGYKQDTAAHLHIHEEFPEVSGG